MRLKKFLHKHKKDLKAPAILICALAVLFIAYFLISWYHLFYCALPMDSPSYSECEDRQMGWCAYWAQHGEYPPGGWWSYAKGCACMDVPEPDNDPRYPSGCWDMLAKVNIHSTE